MKGRGETRVKKLIGLLVGCLSMGCSALGFTSHTPAPTPTPAAAADGQRLEVPEIPFALAQPDDFVVRVVAGDVTCSGTLVDEQVVLTAHHCVSERKHGEVMNRNVGADEVRVELGGDYLPWGEVDVKAIVAPGCGYRSGPGDLALLVLDRKLIGVSTATPRLDAPPGDGEIIDPVGFGRCALTRDGIRRRARVGGKVSRVRTLRFNLEASICPGDSGGPALSQESGEVVGVISASVMDGDADTLGMSEFTRLDAFRPLFANAKAIAGGASPAELPPVDVCPSKR